MRYLFCLLCAGFLLTGCQTDGSADLLTTESGNRYSLFTDNRSGEVVKIGDYVYFHAAMRSEGDSIILSTRDMGGEPQVIQVTAIDPTDENTSPIVDVISKMAMGDSAVIRVNMDKFPSKPPGLEMDSVMLYDIVITEAIDEETFNSRLSEEEQANAAAVKAVMAREEEMLDFADQVVSDYTAGKLDGELQTTESGLKYIIHEQGSGPQAEAGKGVIVQYIGKLTADGSVFDQSFERGEGIGFPLGQGRVIPGWDEGIALLKQGGKATLFIPSELGYGARGAGADIPPNSELAFYVELEEVQ